MNLEPSISCIIPVYNGARFVAGAIESVLTQTNPPEEIIVVDDGSTDAIEQVLAPYFGRIVYERQPNRGPGAARNRGVTLSRGEFLSFLDADDTWHADKLRRQMGRFRDNPALELCLTYKRNEWEPAMRAEEERLRGLDHPLIHDHPGFVFQTALVRRETFDRVGPIAENLRIGEDTEWFARAGRLGVVQEILPDVLVFRRLHGANLSYSASPESMSANRVAVVFEHLKRKRGSAPRS